MTGPRFTTMKRYPEAEMKRRLYKTKFRPARRHFDIVPPEDDDEYEVILGAGTDKQPASSDTGASE